MDCVILRDELRKIEICYQGTTFLTQPNFKARKCAFSPLLPNQSYHFSLCYDFICICQKKAVTLHRNLIIAAFVMQVSVA